MKVNFQSEYPLTDEACREATGKTLSEWYAEIDAIDGLAKGRREVGSYLGEKIGRESWWPGAIAVEYERERNKLEKDGRPKGYFICSTKTLNVPVEEAYRAWTSAESLASWFGSGVKIDLKEGGEFVDPDGNHGTFKRIRENKDLRFTWVGESGDESLVDVVLTDKGGGKTGLLVNHDRLQTKAEADGIRRAWSEAIDRMKKHLESK